MSVFNCRMCSGSFWGEEAAPPKARKEKPKRAYEKRTPDQMAKDLKVWKEYVHPRALEFFPTDDGVTNVLKEILNSVDRRDDPILCGDEKCVIWHGDATKPDTSAGGMNGSAHAVVRIVKPGEQHQAVTFVNRVLPFIFADDESFEDLMRLPKDAFHMSCGNQLCVNMSHISFQKMDEEDLVASNKENTNESESKSDSKSTKESESATTEGASETKSESNSKDSSQTVTAAEEGDVQESKEKKDDSDEKDEKCPENGDVEMTQ